VYYVGQPVVAVLADSEALAADAAALVSVEYDETAPVVDPEAAMRDGAEMVLDEENGEDGEEASLHGA
jgi:carbon-monoxide dehydrogenase large subunit